MYVCGPTVSGEPHVGHGRLTLTWDVMRRYAGWSGVDVRFVSNVTDIEDKIIAQAGKEGRPAQAVAAHYEALWWATMDRLGVARPTDDPHATAYIPEMIELIGELVDRGHAYRGGDGVYFAAESVPDYGLLARQPIESLRAGARVEVSEEAGKRSPIDFVLWKTAKPGEPSWESPWGAGRPGWHTECVVMSLGLLGEGFDLHAGGIDLAFPHHENERAQAEGVGRRFARRWSHSGMVVAEGGEKMSKSAGNIMSLPDLLDAWDPRAYRLLVLQSHYRSPITVSEASLQAAERTLRGLDQFATDFAAARTAPPDRAALEAFRERMDDDLDSPAAVAGLFELGRSARAAGGATACSMASAALQIWEHALGMPVGRPEVEIPPEVAVLVSERTAARARREWAASDALRDRLVALGWVVEDGPEGTAIHR
jgi:cysteinyl-tRNA synthetase